MLAFANMDGHRFPCHQEMRQCFDSELCWQVMREKDRIYASFMHVPSAAIRQLAQLAHRRFERMKTLLGENKVDARDDNDDAGTPRTRRSSVASSVGRLQSVDEEYEVRH